MAHFIVCKKTSDANKGVVLFFKEVLRLNGFPRSITSDKDTRFLGHFWKTLQKKMGSKLLYSLTYHPWTDGQTEVVNINLGNLLRSLSGENSIKWDMVLAQGELFYNVSVNRSSSKSPFQIVYGRLPKGAVDLINFPDLEERKSVDASDFVHSIQEMHEQVKHMLQQSNTKYKKRADLQRRMEAFEEGEMVMAHLRKGFLGVPTTN